jgi:hypothetical protein
MTAVAARPRVAARVRSGAALSPAPRSPVPYLPGIDGLRAIAVVAVLLFHAGFGWMPGGYLGVEVFFFISGYLITLLLVSEYERTGRISATVLATAGGACCRPYTPYSSWSAWFR